MAKGKKHSDATKRMNSSKTYSRKKDQRQGRSGTAKTVTRMPKLSTSGVVDYCCMPPVSLGGFGRRRLISSKARNQVPDLRRNR